MKTINTLIAGLGLTIGLSSVASATQATQPVSAGETSAGRHLVAQLDGKTRVSPAIELAARTITRTGRVRRAGRYGRRWVRGRIGPRRRWSGRNNRTSGRFYNPTSRAIIQHRISRHRRHFRG